MTDTAPMARATAASRLERAALAQLVAVGADALTMEAIAVRAGVSIGAAYRWSQGLDQAVERILAMHLPPLAERMSQALSLYPWLQPPVQEDRLLAEGLLAIRRFPAAQPAVRAAVEIVTDGLTPLGAAVIVGCQAAGLAGCRIPPLGLRSLSGLFERLRQHDGSGDLPWVAPGTVDFHPLVDSTTGPDADRIGRRLITATANTLTQSGGDTTLRNIAESAGLTTGAIYRRYGSKDQLVADTIRAYLRGDRTSWAVPFISRLAGVEPGDPAAVLAQQLSEVAEMGSEESRLFLEFLAAARMSPDARQALVQRIQGAQVSRERLFIAMSEAGMFTQGDSPLALSWAMQIAPTGVRLLGLALRQPSAGQWLPVMQAMLRSL